MTRLGQTTKAVSRGFAYLPLVMAPLPYGSVDTAWIAVWCTALSLSVLVMPSPIQNKSARVALLVLGLVAIGWIATVYGQQTMDAMTSDARALWANASGDLGLSLRPRNTATAQSPALSAGPPLVLLLTAMRFLVLGTEPNQARVTMRLFAIASLIIGVLSFAAYIADPTDLLGRPKIYYLGSFTGTFVSRNTAATFFGTATIVWLSSLLARVHATAWPLYGRRRVDVMFAVLNTLDGRILGPCLGTIVCLGCTAATASRAGFILTLLASTIIGLLSYFHTKRRRSIVSTGIVALLVVATLFILFMLLGERVSVRLASNGLTDVYRLEVYRICLGLIRDHPWLGTGLGTFETVLPGYRSATMGLFGVWERSHSSPLEVAVEMGLPFFILLSVVWISAGALLLRHCFDGNDREIALAALGIYILGTLHSTVDFSLQITGYAIIFVALISVGLCQGKHEVDLQHVNEKATGDIKGRLRT